MLLQERINAQFFTPNHKVHDEVQEWNPVLEQKKGASEMMMMMMA